jgi:hypothetical protein
LILLIYFERPTTCRYHMPYVVAYVVAVVEASSRTFQGSVGADSRRNNLKNVHAAIEDQAPGRSGRPDARPRYRFTELVTVQYSSPSRFCRYSAYSAPGRKCQNPR